MKVKIKLTEEQMSQVYRAVQVNHYNRTHDRYELELSWLQVFQVFMEKEKENRAEDILAYAKHERIEISPEDAEYIAEELFENMLPDSFWDCYWESIHGMIRELKGE